MRVSTEPGTKIRGRAAEQADLPRPPPGRRLGEDSPWRLCSYRREKDARFEGICQIKILKNLNKKGNGGQSVSPRSENTGSKIKPARKTGYLLLSSPAIPRPMRKPESRGGFDRSRTSRAVQGRRPRGASSTRGAVAGPPGKRTMAKNAGAVKKKIQRILGRTKSIPLLEILRSENFRAGFV